MSKIIIVSGPVIIENSKVLLNRHGDDGFWKFCGGRVENYDMSLADSAHRKVKEEMGIDIQIIDNEPFLFYMFKENPEGNIDLLVAHFLAKRIGEIVPGKDILEWNWFDIKNLPQNLAPSIMPVLEHFQQSLDRSTK